MVIKIKKDQHGNPERETRENILNEVREKLNGSAPNGMRISQEFDGEEITLKIKPI